MKLRAFLMGLGTANFVLCAYNIYLWRVVERWQNLAVGIFNGLALILAVAAVKAMGRNGK